MKRNKVKALLMAMLLLSALLLGGCQLARESTEQDDDRLIGVFLTWEYLDLFDHAAFMDDNMDKIVHGKEISGNGAAYQGRLYAVQKENRDFVFEGVEGMNYFVPLCTDEMGNTYHMICADAGISGGVRHIHSSDDGEALTLKGTIYVAPRQGERVLYENPVYQTSDGRVYTVQGGGMGFGDSVGGFSFKTEESSTVTNGQGKSVKQSLLLEITVEEMEEVNEIRVYQMNGDHGMLKNQAFHPENTPDCITPDAECAYLIVERITDSEIQRKLIERTEEGTEIFVRRQDGVMEANYMQILWQE